MPLTVPPVPTPTTRTSSSSPSASQISGPVVATCAAGLFGLEYWSGFQAFGVSSARRRETE